MLSATTMHSLAIAASGTDSVVLTVSVDGVQTGTVTDSGGTLPTSHPGVGLNGDGTTANSQIIDWQDHQGFTPATLAALEATSPYACTSGSGSCFDNFTGQSKALLPQYNTAWSKATGTADALLTGSRSVQLNGKSYAY